MARALMVALGLSAAGLSVGPAFAASTTALYPAEIDKIMNQYCVRERGRARDAALRENIPWEAAMNNTNSVLRANMDVIDVQRMLDRADSIAASTSNPNQRHLAEFQSCVLMHKLHLTEGRQILTKP